jgi:methylmalonyl-CoA/ethylmalonyl-CoA epimerase
MPRSGEQCSTFVGVMGLLKFHHLGVAVTDIESALKVYQELFGYHLVSGPFDDPIQRVRVCFLKRGQEREVTIELVAPLGGDSPIKNILQKGGGAYHLCFETSSIGVALAAAVEKGCLLVSGPIPAVAFDGARISWLFTPSRQLVELIERPEPQDNLHVGVAR